ncbi:MAG: hypothetical protein ACREHD_18375, partial [Pirellulales bacterium]
DYADAALTDATDNAGAVKGASDGDALAAKDYTTAESSAYDGEVTGDATALDGEQTGEANAWLSAVQQLATYNFSPWNDSPWVQQLLAQAQAEANLVDGVTGQEGTAQAEMDQTDQEATDLNNQETDDASAQYTRDLAADVDQYNLTVGQAQAAHDAQYAQAASDQALVTAGAFPADLPGTSAAPADGTPLTASANYGVIEDIGGYSIGSTAGTYQGLVSGMFGVGPNTEPWYTGWTGWYGWEPAYAPPVPANSTSGPSAASASASGTSGGTWSSDGATAPSQAPQMYAATDGAPGNGAKPQDETGNGQPSAGGPAGSGQTNTARNWDPATVQSILQILDAQLAAWWGKNLGYNGLGANLMQGQPKIGNIESSGHRLWVLWEIGASVSIASGNPGNQQVTVNVPDSWTSELVAQYIIQQAQAGGDIADEYRHYLFGQGADGAIQGSELQKGNIAAGLERAGEIMTTYLEVIGSLNPAGAFVFSAQKVFDGRYLAGIVGLTLVLPWSKFAQILENLPGKTLWFEFAGGQRVGMSASLMKRLRQLSPEVRQPLINKFNNAKTADEARQVIIELTHLLPTEIHHMMTNKG